MRYRAPEIFIAVCRRLCRRLVSLKLNIVKRDPNNNWLQGRYKVPFGGDARELIIIFIVGNAVRRTTFEI